MAQELRPGDIVIATLDSDLMHGRIQKGRAYIVEAHDPSGPSHFTMVQGVWWLSYKFILLKDLSLVEKTFYDV